MKVLTDKELGFILLPKQSEECDDGFAYRVAEIKTATSFIEVINEYRDNKITSQFSNYELIDESSKPVNVELIKRLKQIIL